MTLVEVNDRMTQRAFISLPLAFYKDDPNWIRPIDKDIEDVFDPKENKLFRHGKAIRWLLYDDNNKAIGRVAAFINEKTAKSFKQPTGGMGFFECIDDQEAAFMMFDACKNWLVENEMEAMDGPINFGERDRWWGLLVEKFIEPNYCCNYNPPYYQKFFEAYGFKTYFEQYTYFRVISDPLNEKYEAKGERISKNPKYHFESIKLNNLEKYAEDFRYVYNKAWVRHTGVKEMPKVQAMAIFKKMKPVIDVEVVWFVYYGEEAVGFYIMLPELNQIFKHVNGKLDLRGKLIFLYHKWMHTTDKLMGVAFGIIPNHQGKGVEAALVLKAGTAVQRKGRYKEFEMNWIGDFNPKMMHIVEDLGGRKNKVHITYRLLFDPNATFERAPMLD